MNPLPKGFGQTLKRLIAAGKPAKLAMKEAWKIHRKNKRRNNSYKKHFRHNPTSLEFIDQAINRYKKEGDKGIDWVFFRIMSQKDRDLFDKFLVETKHPLASQPGTTEYRFKKIVWESAKVRNPYKKSSKRKFVHRRLQSSSQLYHLRTIKAGKHRVIIGCPVKHKGRCPVPTVAKTVLHPKSEKKKNPIAIYNPNIETRIPATNIEIRYRRANGAHQGQWFKHAFGTTVSMYGLDNGAIMLRSNQRKKLWGTVD